MRKSSSSATGKAGTRSAVLEGYCCSNLGGTLICGSDPQSRNAIARIMIHAEPTTMTAARRGEPDSMAGRRCPHDFEAVLKSTLAARPNGDPEFTRLDNELELTVVQTQAFRAELEASGLCLTRLK